MRVVARTNLAIALAALLVFHLVAMSSGRVTAGNGLGWDGQAYALMLTGSLSDGTPNTALRPLVVLAARIPHAVGASVIRSFQIVDYLASFALSLIVGAMLARRGMMTAVRAAVTVNLSLCIATAKMFGYYPVLIDLGALAVISLAFYLAATDRPRLAAIACAVAPLAREFGIAPALYAIHRSVRLRRPWHETLSYVPGLVVLVVMRMPWVGLVPPSTAPMALGDALDNLRLWSTLRFPAAFAYFAVTLFGGVSMLIMVRPWRCLTRLRAEPELVTFAAPILFAAAAGNADIWRYLAYLLPVAIVLAADCFRGCDRDTSWRLLVAVTLLTILTQRPFEAMTTELYFRDWFPLYTQAESMPETTAIWTMRGASLLLAIAALFAIVRRNVSGIPQRADQAIA